MAGFGVEVVALWVQRRRVRVAGADDTGDPGDAWLRTAGVVEEEQFAVLHAAHEVASLVIAYAISARTTKALQVVNRQFVGFGFHQPVRHELCSCLPVFAGGLSFVPAIVVVRRTMMGVFTTAAQTADARLDAGAGS